ncbi:MAG: T9SS type A sorting domain-containing protein [Ignavibacteriales bacterium]|nr:T9SS type A sorting domain-containing protein [Ignavibacteriota bacterium]MCB9220136.1 T9SS type A sorting domain-containing protein [Ignavibacteriales bacterium]
MKNKFLLFLLILMGNFSVSAQLLNGSFETWNELGPEFWVNSNVATQINSVTKSDDAQDGSSSIQMEIVNFANLPFPAWVQSIDADGGTGHPISQKYSSLKGYVKTDFKGSALFIVTVLVNDESSGTIGIGGLEFTTSLPNWSAFEVPIEYYLDGNPNSVYIQFYLADSSDSGDLNSVGSIARIDNLSLDGVTEVQLGENVPLAYSLNQNYPNPFNPSTVVNFTTPELSQTNVTIYNSLGEEIKTLVDEELSPGFHEVNWNAENLPSGIYFIKINANSTISSKHFTDVKKAMLIK